MTGFADRFSHTQRAALAALGYTVLEQRTSGDPCDRVGAAVGREQPTRAGELARGAGGSEAPPIGDGRSRPTAAPTRGRGALPGHIEVQGLDGSPLACAILAAATAPAGEGDARVQQLGERLDIALGGEGGTWQLTLEQLRRSPKHKAALWRALRSLARSGA
jgi:hypothetical protein